MNLAEFPISLLSERAPRGVTTLEFEIDDWDSGRKQMVKRKLTVEGSPKHGLPTAKDEEVLLGLIQLTKDATDFASPVVAFTQRSFLKSLDWSTEGRSYFRLRQAFFRLQGVTLYYENAWRDNADRCYVTQGGFSVLSRFELRDGRYGRRNGDCSQDSVFEWSSVIQKSFQDNYLKGLDYELVKSFKHPATRRLYRHLDKHFYPPKKETLTYDLETLAYQHVGIRPRKDTHGICTALEPAVAELESVGYIRKLPRKKRFRKISAKNWSVQFTLATHRSRAKDNSTSNHDQRSARKSDEPRFRDRYDRLGEAQRKKLLSSALKFCKETCPRKADGFRRNCSRGGNASEAYLEIVLEAFAQGNPHLWNSLTSE